MYGAQHPKADVDRLYLQRCEGERGTAGLDDCVQVEAHSLDKYLSTSKEKMLNEVSHSRIVGRNKEEIDKEHQEKYEEKPLPGHFRKVVEEVRGKRSWDWLKKGYLKKETESTIVASQDQALITRNMRNVVYGENVQSICVYVVLLMKQLHILFQNAQN